MLGAARGRPSAASPPRIPPSSSLSLSLLFLFLFPFYFSIFFSLFSFLPFLFFFSFCFLPPSSLSFLPSFPVAPACPEPLPACPPARASLPCHSCPGHDTCSARSRARAHNARRAGLRRPHRPRWRRCAPRRDSQRTRTACPERRRAAYHCHARVPPPPAGRASATSP